MKLTVRHICRILAGFPLILTLALMAPLAHAICSSDYKGLATINEVRQPVSYTHLTLPTILRV